MRNAAIKLLAACMLISGFHYASAEEALVLVTSGESPIREINSLEIRKIYLGLNVRDRQGRQIVALTNSSDDRVMTVFLQNVMAMSKRAYNRRLLTLAVQSGRVRPRVVASLSELRTLLAEDTMAVSCMWKTDADQFPDLRILRVLWTE